MFYQGNYHRRNQYGTNNRDLTGRIAALKQRNAQLYNRYFAVSDELYHVACEIGRLAPTQFMTTNERGLLLTLRRRENRLETLKRTIRSDISANDLERERTQERHEFELTGKFGGCGPRILTYRYTVVRSKRSPWREREHRSKAKDKFMLED